MFNVVSHLLLHENIQAQLPAGYARFQTCLTRIMNFPAEEFNGNAAVIKLKNCRMVYIKHNCLKKRS